MRTSKRLAGLIIVACTLLLVAGTAQARRFSQEKCEKARCDAAANYGACQQKGMGKYYGYGAGETEKLLKALGKCAAKYTATWPKLQKKAAGTRTTCAAARFINNGTTVTDNLTGLEWEKKTDDGGVHDKDDLHSWSWAATVADGTVFTSFLRMLNSSPCFAGQCDWRLPTVAELQTILLEPYHCETSPCIDPIFGPTAASHYWSSNTSAFGRFYQWTVVFDDGDVVRYYDTLTSYVRAVRGGL